MQNHHTSYRVLIVEDEFYIADDLMRSLDAHGILVAGPVANHAAALAELDKHVISFALVDINLDGSVSFEVAAELRERGIPFLFLTGYDRSVVPQDFQDAVLLQKPLSSEVLITEIQRQKGLAA